MEWNEARTRSVEASGDDGSGSYLKLKDGDKVEVAFLGGPKPRETIWDDGRSHDVESDDWNRLVAQGKKPKLRWVLNVGVGDDIKTWETSNRTFQDEILDAIEDRDPTKNYFTITRRGVDLDTRYKVRWLREMTDHEQRIHAMQADPRSEQPQQAKRSSNNDYIEPEVADQIVQLLRSCSRDEKNRYLDRFGVDSPFMIDGSRGQEALDDAKRTSEREKFLNA